MPVRLMQPVKYLGIQIALDIFFCVVAGIVAIVYGAVILNEGFDYVLLLAAPAVYMIPVFVRYVTLLEIIPRVVLHYLLCGENKFKLWMALIIGLVSYGWSISSLQWFHDWDQGSWFFPFYDVEGMLIYTVCMVISTLVSPIVFNYFEKRKNRR